MLHRARFCSWTRRAMFVILLITSSFVLAQKTMPQSQLPTSTTDLEIEKLLNNVISRTKSLNSVKIHVESGIVSIDGIVPTTKDSDGLKELARQLPYVIAVVDKTELSAPNLTDLNPVWTELHSLLDQFKHSLPSLLIAFLLLVLCYFFGGFIHRAVYGLWSRKIVNPFLLTTVSRFTLLPIWLMFFYFVVKMLGLSTLGATLIGGTGLLGIVLGLSFKGIAENYLAGLLLATRSPFTRGDLIIIGKYKGYVQNLNMRGTTIIDFSGNLILIPNTMVIQSVVENQTANPKTRTQFNISIGYHESISKAQDLIMKALSEVQGVIADPSPSVIVNQFGSTRIELTVRIWFNVKENREMRIRSLAMIRTKETLIASGFSVPNETREVAFISPLKIENIQSTGSSAEALVDRQVQIQKQAVSNLIDLEQVPSSHDPSSEEMLQQAEKNPLPLNLSEKDFLKKE